uniref:WRKY19-like zinc finger domain-containing protein n=1 Tax=Timema bartmani TaxID=61472 RepID=A0A7R9F887_9NEOP|nr:unnamed protein product [Timema bartmani]
MEERVHDSEIENTEMERTCEVFIKEENVTEYEMELNPLEFVSVAIKSEVVDYCEPDSPSDVPSVKQKDEMSAQVSALSQSTTQLSSEINSESEETKTHSVITNDTYETKCNVDCCKQGKTSGLCSANGGGYCQKKCGVEDCSKRAQKGGLCVAHGGLSRWRCSVKNCSKQAYKGGTCSSHGGIYYKKKCSVEDCSRQALKGGICSSHGGLYYKKKCSVEDCSNQEQKGGFCGAHGVGYFQKKCSVEDCSKLAQKGGLCAAHKGCYCQKKCSVEDCSKLAQKGGLCSKHGGGYCRWRCSVENCSRQALKGGTCSSHGGISYKKKCSVEDCSNQERRGLKLEPCDTEPVEMEDNITHILENKEIDTRQSSEVVVKDNFKLKSEIELFFQDYGNDTIKSEVKDGLETDDRSLLFKHGTEILFENQGFTSQPFISEFNDQDYHIMSEPPYCIPPPINEDFMRNMDDVESSHNYKDSNSQFFCRNSSDCENDWKHWMISRHVYILEMCRIEDCSKYASEGEYCGVHGGIYIDRNFKGEDCPRQTMDGEYGQGLEDMSDHKQNKGDNCSKSAEKDGDCLGLTCDNSSDTINHTKEDGLKPVRKDCEAEGCTKPARKGGFCRAHGRDHIISICASEGCSKFAQRIGFCGKHRKAL